MARPLFGRIGQQNPPEGQIITGYRPVKYVQKGLSPKSSNFMRTQTKQVPIYGIDPNAFLEKQQQQQQAFINQQTAAAQATQADIAKQLQIVQQEKSAVAKMTEDYTAMLKAEADAKRKAQEEERIALEEARIASQTARANQARAGQQANLQIQSAGRTPLTAGTQGFRARRVSRLKSMPISSALNIGTAQTLNI